MPIHAALPSWMIFVLIVMFVGPVMRMITGGRPGWRRLERLDLPRREEIARLEEALAERDAVLEDLQRRLSEMESRLDFTERMLSERSG